MFEITVFFLFLIVSVQMIVRYCPWGYCPVWTKHTLWAGMHKNITKIEKIHIST